jgi:hypothetical protein
MKTKRSDNVELNLSPHMRKNHGWILAGSLSEKVVVTLM